MEHINSYIIAVCFAAIFSSVVQILSPSKKFGGIISLVLGIFILYTILSPLAKLVNFSDGAAYDSDFCDYVSKFDFDNAVKSASERALKIEVQNAVRQITDSPVEVRAEVGDSTAIYLSGVPPQCEEKVRSYIKDSFGVEPNISEP